MLLVSRGAVHGAGVAAADADDARGDAGASGEDGGGDGGASEEHDGGAGASGEDDGDDAEVVALDEGDEAGVSESGVMEATGTTAVVGEAEPPHASRAAASHDDAKKDARWIMLRRTPNRRGRFR